MPGWHRSVSARPTSVDRIALRRRRPDRRDAASDRDAVDDGGFESATVDLISGAFREAGFVPFVSGASAASAEQTSPPLSALREGDAIGVSLVGGDLEMGATGTVTHIDGNRVYAFGHPFYGLGPTEFPLTRAYVY